MRRKILPFILLFVFASSCGTVNHVQTNVVKTQPQVRDYAIQAVLWQQNAAEYRALCYQAFNLAKLRLDMFLQDESLKGKRLAVITDIDETVMDNSPYNAKLILEGIEYTPENWTEWVEREEALAVPGATSFLNYAKERGVEVFYVSNRMYYELDATIRNMKKLNFPFAEEKNVLLKKDIDAKDDRFSIVKNDYTVLLFLGDNLLDFSGEFIIADTEKRKEITRKYEESFGNNFIVLPNPMYGDWETKGIYKGNYDWTYPQKDSIWRETLRAY